MLDVSTRILVLCQWRAKRQPEADAHRDVVIDLDGDAHRIGAVSLPRAKDGLSRGTGHHHREARSSNGARPRALRGKGEGGETSSGGPAEAVPPQRRARLRAVDVPFFAAFALGAAMAATAQIMAGRGAELAALAAVIAGVQTLAAAFSGKPHAERNGD